jgi:hypothetical protein
LFWFPNDTQVHDPYFNLDTGSKRATAGIGLGFGIQYSSSTAMVTLVDSLSNFTTNLDASIGMASFFLVATLHQRLVSAKGIWASLVELMIGST